MVLLTRRVEYSPPLVQYVNLVLSGSVSPPGKLWRPHPAWSLVSPPPSSGRWPRSGFGWVSVSSRSRATGSIHGLKALRGGTSPSRCRLQKDYTIRRRLASQGWLGRPCLSCQTSSRTSLNEIPQLVIGHAALLDLAAERSEGLVYRGRFLDVSRRASPGAFPGPLQPQHRRDGPLCIDRGPSPR